jgi:hypothetical protein
VCLAVVPSSAATGALIWAVLLREHQNRSYRGQEQRYQYAILHCDLL